MKKPTKAEPVTIMTEESRDNDQDEDKHEFPTLDSSKNILGLRCTERVSKLICQYITEQSGKEIIPIPQIAFYFKKYVLFLINYRYHPLLPTPE